MLLSCTIFKALLTVMDKLTVLFTLLLILYKGWIYFVCWVGSVLISIFFIMTFFNISLYFSFWFVQKRGRAVRIKIIVLNFIYSLENSFIFLKHLSCLLPTRMIRPSSWLNFLFKLIWNHVSILNSFPFFQNVITCIHKRCVY